MREFRMQLKDLYTGETIITSGGTVFVAVNGGAAKETLKDKDGAALSNPVTPTRGFINFFTADTVEKVDLYILAPGGQFVVRKDVRASGPNEVLVDTNSRHQCMVIPVAAADVTPATETETGFAEPANALMLPSPFIDVLEIDDTETLDVGTDSGDSGDADGFIDGVSVATAGVAKATVANSGNTLGALFEVQDSANAGDLTHEGRVSGGKAITVTTSAGTDTLEAFVHLPYLLAA
ncbi:MAG: hypothetical protein AB7F39_06645 [Variibacter sp.]